VIQGQEERGAVSKIPHGLFMWEKWGGVGHATCVLSRSTNLGAANTGLTTFPDKLKIDSNEGQKRGFYFAT
jgi:hypothetical protein